MRKNKKGFTLIELLVVIAIIGLLSTLAVIALNNARQKARDARRITDIKQIQQALELYMNDASYYPEQGSTTAGTINEAAWGTGSISHDGVIYMNIVPTNPEPEADTDRPEYDYRSSAPDTYSLTYELESGAGGLSAGVHTASEVGIDL